MVPVRAQQEPTDWRAYDRWQTREGLMDADDKVKAAWAAFAPAWEEDLTVRLGADAPEPVAVSLDPLPDELVRCGKAFGQIPTTRRPMLTDAERERFLGWRKRILRADVDAWSIFWQLVRGDGLGLVAARHETDGRYCAGVYGLAVKWWNDDGATRIVAKSPIFGIG